MNVTTADCGTILSREPRSDMTAWVGRLATSAEPAVVFASLADLCVPRFSDVCTVDITEDGLISYRIHYPGGDVSPTPEGTWTVRTRFEAVEIAGSRKYTGVVTHNWATHEPTPHDVAQSRVLVSQAVTAIYRERVSIHRRASRMVDAP